MSLSFVKRDETFGHVLLCFDKWRWILMATLLHSGCRSVYQGGQAPHTDRRIMFRHFDQVLYCLWIELGVLLAQAKFEEPDFPEAAG